MIYVIVALQSEARPLIDHFALKPSNRNRWRVYRNESMVLIVSGTGKIRSAMAATYLYSHSESTDITNGTTLNIGICGSSDSNPHKIGDLLVVNQVYDHGSQRFYFPDMLLHHNLPEAGLETFDSPVTREGTSTLPLVDMEAAGFFEAAGVYFSPDRILCLKIVSDYLGAERLSPTIITKLVGSRIEEIEHLITDFKKIHVPQPLVLAEQDKRKIASLGKHLKFSTTQQHQLNTLVEAYLIRKNDNLDFIQDFLKKDVNSKYEAKQCFSALRSILSQP